MAGMDGVSPAELLLVTITPPGRVAEPGTWNAEAVRRLAGLMEAVRDKFAGARVEWLRVSEWQERGLLHFHVLMRGLRYLPHAWLKRAARRHGFGFVWVGRVKSARLAAWYVAKYLSKADSKSAFGKGARVYGASRGWRLVPWRRRESQPGRFVMAPPLGMSWFEWAGPEFSGRFHYGAPVPPWLRPAEAAGVWAAPPGLFD